MIKITKQNNSLIVEGIDNVFYINNGDNSYPLNSLIVVTDKSDMATFRSVATNDVLFSGLIQNITINGEAVTKDNIIAKFDAVSNSSTGGGTVDAYTKEEADEKFASKDELTNVQTVANDADTKVDALTPRVEGVETAMNNKQDLLVSGTNIKTINNQSILGEGNIEISDYYTKTEADEIFATTTQVNHQAADISALQTDMRGKQATLVSGENIKTINSESILGTGDIQINGVSDEQAQEIAKIPTIESELAQKANVSDVPTVQTGNDGTNKNYIYSTPFDSNYSVYSRFNFEPNEQGIQMRSEYWGGNSASLFQIPLVTTSENGVMSAADKTKLDSIPETIPSQSEIDGIAANVSALEADMVNKQPTLVSGINIKTINNESLLGEGNIEVAKKTDIPSTDNLATKDELTAVETVANNADAKADAATSRVESVETSLNNKQDILVSGTNIKTINSQSILGEGNIEVSGVSEEQAQEIAKIPTIETELAQKANVSDIPTVQTSINGNVKTYIYSDPGGYMKGHRVIANLDFQNSTDGKLNLRIFPWGDKNKTMIYRLPVPSATTTAAGVMSAADKTKLDSIPENIPTQTEVDNIASNVSALQTAMDGKQPTLVSGTNIKTINGNSILGEGNLVIEGGGIDLSNYYTKTETDTKLDTKQNTLVSGTNIKTINSQSILGEGNIEVTISDATTATSGAMSAADKTKLDSISNEWTGTQSEFDALTTKEDNIIYYVTE